MSDAVSGTFHDFVDIGEDVHRSIVDVCHQLEVEGWRVVKRSGRSLRYWCPCQRRHQLWITLAPVVEERLDFYLNRTCFTFQEKRDPS